MSKYDKVKIEAYKKGYDTCVNDILNIIQTGKDNGRNYITLSLLREVILKFKTEKDLHLLELLMEK